MSHRFADRSAAGRVLGERLRALHLRPPLLVLALPRGGVPVGAAVAAGPARTAGPAAGAQDRRALAASNWRWPRWSKATRRTSSSTRTVQRGMGATQRLHRSAGAGCSCARSSGNAAAYLSGRPPTPVEGRTVIVVDDGIATGTTMRAALKALRRRRPAALVLAVPVAPRDTLEQLRGEVDQVVCLDTPCPFFAVGAHYLRFHQVEDDEVIEALDMADRALPGRSSAG